MHTGLCYVLLNCGYLEYGIVVLHSDYTVHVHTYIPHITVINMFNRYIYCAVDPAIPENLKIQMIKSNTFLPCYNVIYMRVQPNCIICYCNTYICTTVFLFV